MTTAAEPRSRRKNRGMEPEEVERRFPSLKTLALPPDRAGERAWVATFKARPDAMHSMLADLIKQVHAIPGRIGQRPMPKEADVDFQALLYGEENDLPLVEVLPKIMTVSERAFCAKIHMSRAQFQRLLRSQYSPDANELRQIAAAVRKPPAYFIEYRKIMAISAFVSLIDERPGIATSLYRDYLEVRLGEAAAR